MCSEREKRREIEKSPRPIGRGDERIIFLSILFSLLNERAI
jgi:hypothetical protein